MNRVLVRDAQGRIFGRRADKVREDDTVLDTNLSPMGKEQFVDARPDEDTGETTPAPETKSTKKGEEANAVVPTGEHQGESSPEGAG